MRRTCFYCFWFSTYNFALFFNFYQNTIVQISIILSIITFNFLFLGSLKLAGFVCSFFCCLDAETHPARGSMGFWFSRSESYILGLEIASPLASLYFSPCTISPPFSLLSVSITLCDQEYYLVLQNAIRFAVFVFYFTKSFISRVFTSFHSCGIDMINLYFILLKWVVE